MNLIVDEESDSELENIILEIENRTNVIDKFPATCNDFELIDLRAPTGSGKTQWICSLVKFWLDKNPRGKVCVLTYRLVLAYKLKKDLDDLGFKLYKENFDSKLIVISCESLHHWKHIFTDCPSLLIMDEIVTLVDHFGSATLLKEIVAFKIAFAYLRETALNVIVCDAYSTDSSEIFIDELKKKFTYIRLDYYDENYYDLINARISRDQSIFISRIVRKLQKQKKIYIWSGSKKYADRLLGHFYREKLLTSNDVKFISADSPESEKRESGEAPDLYWKDCLVAVCTPAIISGVSSLTPRHVFIVCNMSILPSAEIILQAAWRIRNQLSCDFLIYGGFSDDIKFNLLTPLALPESEEQICEAIYDCQIKKINYLRELLQMRRFETMDGYIVRFGLDSLYSSLIITTLKRRFRFYNNPASTLKLFILNDRRYNLKYFNSFRVHSKVIYLGPRFTLNSMDDFNDLSLKNSYESFTQELPSLFSRTVLPMSEADKRFLDCVKVLHCLKLIGTDLYDYKSGNISKLKEIKLFNHRLVTMTLSLSEIIPNEKFCRLLLVALKSKRDLILDDYSLYENPSELPSLADISISSIRIVAEAVGIDFENHIWVVKHSDQWDMEALDKVINNSSSVASIDKLVSLCNLLQIKKVMTTLAEFVRVCLNSIGFHKPLGKKRGRKSGVKYMSNDLKSDWRNRFILYLLNRIENFNYFSSEEFEFPNTEISPSFFFYPLVGQWLSGTRFFFGVQDIFHISHNFALNDIPMSSTTRFPGFFNQEILDLNTFDQYERVREYENVFLLKMKNFRKYVGLYIWGTANVDETNYNGYGFRYDGSYKMKIGEEVHTFDKEAVRFLPYFSLNPFFRNENDEN